MEVKLPALLRNYDIPTDQPGHRETLPISLDVFRFLKKTDEVTEVFFSISNWELLNLLLDDFSCSAMFSLFRSQSTFQIKNKFHIYISVLLT